MSRSFAMALVVLAVVPLVAQSDFHQAVEATGNSVATGKFAAMRSIYLVSAPSDADTPVEAAAHQANRTLFSLEGYESILRNFRKRHDALANQYNSEVAKALAASRVPDPTSFVAQLDALVYSTMNQIRAAHLSTSDASHAAQLAAQEARRSECFKTPCANVRYRLWPGDYIEPGQSLWSEDRAFWLTLQPDGALVLRGKEGPVWSSGVRGRTPAYLQMQIDGNLAIYDGSGNELWSSGTSKPGSSLQVTNDGAATITDRYRRVTWTNGVTRSGPDQNTPSLPSIRHNSGFTVTVSDTTGEVKLTKSVPVSETIYQTVQISGIKVMATDYCREYLIECATVVVKPRWQNEIDTADKSAGGWHEGRSFGLYNYVNEENVVALEVPARTAWKPGVGMDFKSQETVREDPAHHVQGRTGNEHDAAELRSLVNQSKASICFAVTYPPGADVYVDGLKAGATPVGFALLKHDTARVVTVKLPGYKTVQRRIMPDGRTYSVALTLEKDGGETPGSTKK